MTAMRALTPDMVTRKSRAEIERMRRAGRVVAEVLALVESELKPGVSTAHLDRLAEAHIRKAGATPSFKGYPGINPRRPFPGSVCISIDDEIVHGIPGERTIRDGQVVSIDAGAILDGWHGDGARTFYVGDPPPKVAELIDLTRTAMMAGIAAAVPGNHIEDISAAVESVAAQAGLGVIRQFVGHGIGTAMHEEPQVPNYRTGRPGRKLEPGLCLAIEPMFTLGGYDTRIEADDWTVVTADGSLAAHFEHSIAVTDDGPMILTTA
jgi:methionyl aminopeptidase